MPKHIGALKDSIGWTWGAPPKGSMTLGQVKRSSAGALARSALGKRLTITVNAGNEEAFWARWVAFGTKAGLTPPLSDETIS